MVHFKPLFGCLLFCLLPYISISQTLRFEQYTTKDGLPSDEIYNLHQDTKGYIWIFTNYGALKYNGREFKPVLKNLPFNESFFYSIFENKNGQKWAANSNAKIYEIINDSAFVLRGSELISENLRKRVHEIYQIYTDDSLNVFLITKNTCYKLKRKNKTYIPINLSEQITRDTLDFVIIEKENYLLPIHKYFKSESSSFSKTYNSFNLKIQGRGDSLEFKLKGVYYNKLRFFKRYGNDIYFSLYNKLVKITNNKIISTISFNTNIQNFVKDRRGHLWIACYNNGLVEVDGKDSIINHYLKDITINDVLIDSENGLWVSSIGGGLYHCRNLSSLHFNDSESLGRNINFIKIIAGKLYAANSSGDLYVVNRAKFKCLIKNDIKNTPLDIIQFNSDLLISYWHKIERFKISERLENIPITKTIQAENPLKLMGLDEERVLFCNRNALGLITNGKLEKTLKVSQKVYSFELRDKILFLATDKGVYQLKQEIQAEFFNRHGKDLPAITNLIRPDYLSPTKNSAITKVIKDSSGNLWFCSTGNGLYIFSPDNKLTHLSFSNGLPSDIINNVSFSGNRGILLSTNKGLFFADQSRSSFQSLDWKKIYSEEVKNAVLFENKIYAGTTHGLLIFEHKKTNEKEKLYFNLNSVFINAKEANRGALKKMRYDQNNLEFNFDPISFSGNKFSTRYNLTGPVTEEGAAKNNSVKFQHLPAGSYTLIAFPATDKNLKIQLEFKIIPAFWQTSVFLILVSALLLILLFYILRFIILNFQKKEIKKLQAERQISEYKLAALKAQMDPHFIFNSLNTIQQFIITNDNEKAQLYLSTFSQLIRMLLESNTNESICLKEEIEILEKYLEIESLRFNNAFDYEIIVAENIHISSVHIPYFLLQPFVENAIHHGLLPKLGYKELTIRFEMPDPVTLKCIIEDNGVGRKNSSSKKIPFKTKSLGVNFVRQHLAIMSKIEKHVYNVEITDKESEDGTAKGTHVVVTMPIFK